MAIEKKKFQTESKELLNLMINSIYSNKEIFLRELISNASDAIDKRRFESLNSGGKIELIKHPEIKIILNKDNRTLTIKDDGIGMSKKEIISNIGTIAKSGSKEYIEKLKENNNKDNLDIIGQFGVGFYSAFMVAKNIEIETRSIFDEKGYRFNSDGNDSYTIEEIDKKTYGTSITLTLKDDKEDENYTTYLDYDTISYLVNKYSNYIKYPIKMDVKVKEKKKDKDGKELDEYIEKIETKTLNSMTPLWKKQKKDIKEKDLNEFYKTNFNDYIDPLCSINFSVEGLLSYSALLFIPSHIKNEFYNKEEAGLSLYAKNVFIMNKCKDLLPNYLFFLDGLVDSNDLDLNISREMLQENQNIKKIKDNIETKTINYLKDLKKKDKEKYTKFFDLFGSSIKYGMYESFGSKNELLSDLLIFKSLNHEDYIDLNTYINEKKENQKFIYFATGTKLEEIKILPQLEKYKKENIDVLFLDKDVDEFAIRGLSKYKDLEFKSILDNLDNELNEEEKTKLEDLKVTYKRVLDNLKESLKDKVSEITFTNKLIDSPATISSNSGLSFNMERILNNINPNEANLYKSQKVLEINPNHPLFKKISNLNDEEIKEYALVLYNEAMLLSGLEIDKKDEFIISLNKLLTK